MTTVPSYSPFQWLYELEQRAKQKARGLPRQEKVQEIWRGIAFRLGESLLLTPLVEIREILPCPKVLAKIPGAKSWVRGLANVRGGILLPVIDLEACLRDVPPVEGRKLMLLINQAGLQAGLLVDEVLGIKHFPANLRDINTPCKEAWLAPFSKGMFVYDEHKWIVFDIRALVENQKFLQVAV